MRQEQDDKTEHLPSEDYHPQSRAKPSLDILPAAVFELLSGDSVHFGERDACARGGRPRGPNLSYSRPEIAIVLFAVRSLSKAHGRRLRPGGDSSRGIGLGAERTAIRPCLRARGARGWLLRGASLWVAVVESTSLVGVVFVGAAISISGDGVPCGIALRTPSLGVSIAPVGARVAMRSCYCGPTGRLKVQRTTPVGTSGDLENQRMPCPTVETNTSNQHVPFLWMVLIQNCSTCAIELGFTAPLYQSSAATIA